MRLGKAHGLELVEIIGKNSVEPHLSEWKGTCIELSYDVINENYSSFYVNGKQLRSINTADHSCKA